jgi:hypothetical protein
MAIKNGETLELARLYWVANCKSVLKSTPTAEILSGPPNISVSVKQAMVRPRTQSCPKDVSGGILSIAAKDIKELSISKVVIRWKYETLDGDRLKSETYNLTMVP